jgi:GTPase SAR1 family protein
MRMMFIDPDTHQLYIPTPSYFLGCFDIYDREHTLGEELEKFDPNDPADREELILKYCLVRNRTYRHRFLLFKCLEEALQDKSYDFQSLLKYDPEAYSSFPCGWDEMENTRVFFEDIYRLATIEWKEDLQKASLEDQSTW